MMLNEGSLTIRAVEDKECLEDGITMECLNSLLCKFAFYLWEWVKNRDRAEVGKAMSRIDDCLAQSLVVAEIVLQSPGQRPATFIQEG